MKIFASIGLVFCNLFLFSQNTKGDSLFNSANIHNIYLNFSQTGYWDSLTANYTADVYMKCDVVVNGATLPTCGVKFKGNSSYNNPSTKKSFKIDFNEYVSGQKCNGLKKLNLNNGFKDPTLMREKIMLDFLNRAGVPAPRCTYAKLYINNVYWGLYTMVEEINKDFLDDRFSDDKGNLFKGDPIGDLKWYGSSVTSYTTRYELQTNETANNWTDLIYFIDKINNTPSAQLPDSMNKILQVTPWLRSWAASNIFANLDSYIGSGHNYFVYHDSITNKFNWITWDVNEAFGNFNQGMTVSQIETMTVSYTGGGPNNRPLCNKMISNPTLNSAYINEVCYLTGFHFLQSYWFPKIDSIANKIRTDVYADTKKFFTNAQFESNIDTTIVVTGNPGGSNIPGLKSFINRRRASLLTQMAANSCNVGIQSQELENNSFVLKPNPNNGKFVIQSSSINGIKFYNVLGQEVQPAMQKNISDEEAEFNFINLQKGLYYCLLNGKTKKIIIQ